MKGNVASRLNQMARIIREKKAVPFGELCLQMNMAPATMYGYMKIMKNVYLDITFENGLFIATADQKIEELSSQKRLSTP